ncbi:histidine phosphatase family protein [Actinoplanes sp. TRM 88003]|uniref:Histidine phosphatase family protein n=1 Tax=Paractinoplanes aksuensis TaxID=2939490 RepID=A0ABT1DHQ4_9ACTN|nr:histidine phosphatase family protein [Actinoplanes aksuensis]MCO8270368.1 histidine phosphatase family protein [Actinoplanes aksuensis]
MTVEIVFETHALTEDNENGFATGWLPGRLSERGRANAANMGRRRRHDGIAAVFSSDLRRSVETAQIAFGNSQIPILYDWRLRECDFGAHNGSPSVDVGRDRLTYCDVPYPGGGESHSQAIARVARALPDLYTRWSGRRIMLIGHLATYRALEQAAHGGTVHELVAATFEWRPHGWEYRLP